MYYLDLECGLDYMPKLKSDHKTDTVLCNECAPGTLDQKCL